MTTVVPLLLTFFALVVSLAFNLLAFRDRRLTIRLNRQRDVMYWIGELKASYAQILRTESEARKVAVSNLSLLVDVGRLFFPNDSRNRRSDILDPLVETCRRCQAGDYGSEQLRNDWRAFIDRLNDHTTPFRLDTSPEILGKRQYINKGLSS